MLHLNVLHGVHRVRAVHAGMRMEKKHDGAGGGEYRKNPSAPDRLQSALCTENFNDTEGDKYDGERFVLKDFEIPGNADPPVFLTKRPEFRITKDQNENSGKKKTKRPCVFYRRPAIF